MEFFIQRGFTRGDDGVAPWLPPSGPDARVPSFGAAASVAEPQIIPLPN